MGKKKGKKNKIVNKLLHELDSNQNNYTYETLDTILGAEGSKLDPIVLPEDQEDDGTASSSEEGAEEESTNVSQSTLDNFISFPEAQESEHKFELKINCVPWRTGNAAPKTYFSIFGIFFGIFF